MAARLKVELVGLFPTVFTTICKVACNPTGVAGLSTAKDQLREYPQEVVEDMERASAIFLELSRYPDVEIRAIQANSPRGLWLSIRHRLGRGLWAVVDGKAVNARAGINEITVLLERQRARIKAFDNLKHMEVSVPC